MKIEDAKEYIRDEITKKDGDLVQNLAELLVWAYDKGWSEGIEDYREDQDSTAEQCWRASR